MTDFAAWAIVGVLGTIVLVLAGGMLWVNREFVALCLFVAALTTVIAWALSTTGVA